MSDTLVSQYRRWFDYEQDAHAKVIASLASVPVENRTGPDYRKALTRFAHIVAARHIWLFCLGIAPTAPKNIFPDDVDLNEISAYWTTVSDMWQAYFENLTDADVTRDFEYQSLDAGRFRNRIGDILTQLFGHTWYHRGQIAMLVKAAGGQPAATDFVYWCRERIT